MYKYLCLSLILAILIGCQLDQEEQSVEEEIKIAESLALTPAVIDNLPANWQRAANISADPFTESDFKVKEGQGVIYCAENGAHMNTGIEHGDIELDIDFMVPKGSNSGLYFQGRYEVQILDSWNKKTLSYADCGSIYASYDEEEKKVITEGIPPKVNASKAPGLWQNFNIIFRAPRFNADGEKISNAKFEHVYLNGFLVQQNVEVPEPTRAHMLNGEEAIGPLMIQGDHGQVAFRNIKYKQMGFDTISISNITYDMYKIEKMNHIPAFEEMTPTKSGSAENFDKLEDLAGQQDAFAFVFNAELDVPKGGEYLFTTMIDDGGDLFINDQLVVHNEGEPGSQTERGLIDLTAGKHKMKLTYYEEVWNAMIIIYAEGPEMPAHTLASVDMIKLRQSRSNNRKNILVEADKGVEFQRGYIMHNGNPKTHVLSVGDPLNVHYSYDLQEGALLRAWKGGFADATNMWLNRGHSQMLLARNAGVEFDDGVPVSLQQNKWGKERPENYKNKGYRIDENGRPIFLSSIGDVDIEDKIVPTSKGTLLRTLQASKPLWLKVASGEDINFDDQSVSIDGQYYIQLAEASENDLSLKSNDDLVIKLEDEISYEIIW